IDPLAGLPKIKMCVGYSFKGEKIVDFPADLDDLALCTPIYEEFDGFNEDLSGIRDYNDFPATLKRYIEVIERICGCPVSIIGVGPARDQIVHK
ncbi:MAG: adenylosuccinate synthetase, partial [Clostridia bacterium]